MLRWKEERQGETALLIEGARRIGKSTIVEEFAKNEYSSYILVDFSKTATEINDLFWFEEDFIARLLGFDSWEALERYNDSEDNEDDEDEGDDANDET